MQKNMMWLCVLGILVLAIGLAQAADVEQGDGTKNGGPGPSAPPRSRETAQELP